MRECSLRCLRSGHSHEDIDQLFGVVATHLARKGRHCQTADDLVKVIDDIIQSMPRPHESLRFTKKLDGARDWPLVLQCAHWPNCTTLPILRNVVPFFSFARKGFLSEGVPIMLQG